MTILNSKGVAISAAGPADPVSQVCQQIVEQAEGHVSNVIGTPVQLILMGFAENGQGILHVNQHKPITFEVAIKVLENTIAMLKQRQGYKVNAPLGS